ncbi:hypothetical protein L596_001162 [Steinernema carpocapsae]|uniref:Uncharacterized protein n=1 Tax=Steinernema carpocapsae TaxID=34508 RepID=A0A4U8UPH4_STECR|nr:hypothetical protein L596_001162 [Steinernema carpocapsae]
MESSNTSSNGRISRPVRILGSQKKTAKDVRKPSLISSAAMPLRKRPGRRRSRARLQDARLHGLLLLRLTPRSGSSAV